MKPEIVISKINLKNKQILIELKIKFAAVRYNDLNYQL